MQAPAKERRYARFGEFEVDLRDGELRQKGLKIKLQERPFQILSTLLERPGEVVTREEIQQKLWPGDTFVDFEHGINVAVKKLREALGDDAEHPRYIETLPRHGYRFICPVAAAPQPPAHGDEDIAASVPALGTETREGHKGPPLPLWRRLALAVGVLALVATAVLIVLNSGALRDRLLRHPAPVAKIESIAVLPLENLSGDKEQEYFADGLTDALITDLGKVASLRVISRTSVMRYKGTKKSLPEIARELDVDGVVEGTVLRSGGRVRVTAQLLQARTDRHLWAETYERDTGDVIQLEKELALAIAHEVSGRLTTAQETRLASRRAVNPRAFDAYLRGRYLWNEREAQKSAGARAYFEEALKEDPNFALAYSGLADYWSTSWGVEDDQPLAEKYARTAIALEPDLAEGHASLGLTAVYQCKFAEAGRELRRAIELNPNYSMAHHWYSLYFYSLGRPSEALDENDRARQLDPFSLPVNFLRGAILTVLHQYDQAEAQEKTAVVLNPQEANPHWALASIYWIQGRIPEALAEEREGATLAYRPARLHELDEIAAAFAKSGLHAARLKAAQIAERGYCGNQPNPAARRRDCYSAYDVAEEYALLGDKGKTLSWLEQAQRDGPVWSFAGGCGPEYDLVRSDPRFQDLLLRAGLPQ